MEGWVKIHRKIILKGYYKDSEYIHLWIHLLLKSNHKKNEWLYKGKVNICERGQLITSRKTLAQETGISESKVERILKTLKIEQQIEQQNLFTKRVITIKNYNKYQESEQQIEQRVNSKRTASEQPVNTNKNEKNEKNEKNDKKLNIYIGELDIILGKWNEEHNTKYKSKESIKDNYTYWRKEFSLEEILQAIGKTKEISWLNNPTTFFRQRNPTGEKVNYIEYSLNYKKENKSLIYQGE